MESINQYEFVSLNEENIFELMPLYKKVFGIDHTLEHITKKYNPSYTGLNAQGHFALFDGKVVAFHGAIPVLMRHKNTTELAAQYGDAMTLKSHSGKGFVSQLGKLTDRLLIQKGVSFVWGFPNQNSVKFLV